MTLLNKMKAVFTSKEAEEFKKELKETTKNVGEKVEKTVDTAVKKTKEVIANEPVVVVEEVEEVPTYVSYDEFLKIDVRVGTILSVEEIEKSDKLLLLSVDTGDGSPRQIVSGIKNYFDDPQSLAGRQAMFITNLEPRTIFGHVSEGMIFAVNDQDNFSILEPDTSITPGTKAS